METAPLKSFATWARTSLIREVTARIAVVLAPASPERVEQAKAVEALEKAVRSGGGGDKGRAAVADKVAYTWFNRIIALRFMDANGYTGVGVVSSQAGVGGQPEILAEAKRGNFEASVVGVKTRETVTSLLNGTRRSADAQGEAYALLLSDYCRHWNRAMPFMFEREGDFTELLIPGNLLADDSVPSRAVKVLTKDVCQDVEVIGWLYQFYISERKDEVFAGFKQNKKAGADEIPAATQLFTPHWIVRYLVENSLGRLWMLNRPGSRLVDQMEYYIPPVDEETEFLKIVRPEELKVVDPACGSGHMLTYAFDLLYAIYEEEGYAPAEIPGLILTNNLYGIEIDPRAGALAAFAMTMKARAKQRTFFNKQVEPNVCVLDPIRFTPDEVDFLLTRGGDKHAEAAFWNQFQYADTFGSLIQPDVELTTRLKQHIAQLDDGGDILQADLLDWAERVIQQAEYLTSRYAVAVTNPPYMGTRNMSESLRAFAQAAFTRSSGDLCTMFVERTIEMVVPSGAAALVVSESWLFNSSFRELRDAVVDQATLVVTACIDKSAFGVRLNTAASILQRSVLSSESAFFRVSSHDLEAGAPDHLPPSGATVYRRSVVDFGRVPGGAYIFDMPSPLLRLYGSAPMIGSAYELRVGLQTGSNAMFVRQWWEVAYSRIAFGVATREEAYSSRAQWFPYNKGGTPTAWWSSQDHVVNWRNDGEDIRALSKIPGPPTPAVKNTDFYFLPAVTWSNIGIGGARFRLLPQGYIFDVAGMSAFAPTEAARLDLLGYLNCTLVRAGLDVLAPTLNYQVGDVARLPIVRGEGDRERVVRLVDIARGMAAIEETSHDFADNPLVLRGPGALRSLTAGFAEQFSAQAREARHLEEASDAYWSSQIAKASSHSDEAAPPATRAWSIPDVPKLAPQLVSFAVGCMFGRYSLDEPGLILADQGATVQDYLAKVPSPTFAPDRDNVIPIVDGDWFEDDVVARFRSFLRVAFGEQHFEENLRFVTESLGVKDIRDYFVKSFYKDHVQRYRKRPIYWLFSSPKGSFNALIYMHRYTPSTVSTVLNEYLREFMAKLSSSLQQQERLAAGGGTPRQQAAAQKEADRLRKVLLELEEYEHDVLYPLASRQLAIDLDDGVKANYPKFGAALKKIPGLEANDE